MPAKSIIIINFQLFKIHELVRPKLLLLIVLTEKLPYSIRVLLESAVRNCDDFAVKESDVEKILNWVTNSEKDVEIPFRPARVILQDFT